MYFKTCEKIIIKISDILQINSPVKLYEKYSSNRNDLLVQWAVQALVQEPLTQGKRLEFITTTVLLDIFTSKLAAEFYTEHVEKLLVNSKDKSELEKNNSECGKLNIPITINIKLNDSHIKQIAQKIVQIKEEGN